MSTNRPTTWQIASGEDFGRALAEVRLRSGASQQQLADMMGVHRSYLAEMEAGQTVQMLDRLLRAFRRLGAEVTVTAPGRSDDGG